MATEGSAGRGQIEDKNVSVIELYALRLVIVIVDPLAPDLVAAVAAQHIR